MIASNAAKFPIHIPDSIDEALVQKAGIEALTPVAGGTEVMVLFNEGLLSPRPIQTLHRLAPHWRAIRSGAESSLSIGALTTYTDVRHHPIVNKCYPLLVEAARVTGALQIQNRGTLVGNIANGSPAADTVPALMVYNAALRIVSTAGERLVNINEFFTGYRQTVLRPDELIAEILLPPVPAGSRVYYRQVGTRMAQAISKVVVAALRTDTETRIAWGSVAPVTLRSRKTETAIAHGATPEQACDILTTELTPIDDIRSTGDYRLAVSRRILLDLLQKTAPQ